jgi:N-methylhydantoinase A
MGVEGTYAGVDIGGTFTDLVWLNPMERRFVVDKTLTTPADPSIAVESVLIQTRSNSELSVGGLSTLVHGSTLVTNAIIERKGSLTALVTTQGFRDVLHIARQRRYDMFDLQIDLPKPLVPRRLCFEISERVLADGSIAQPLEEGEVPTLAARLREAGVQSVAVCLMHSYRNPKHEQILRERLSKEIPGISISISSEVAPEIREYERASTTTANAYVQPSVRAYMERLRERLSQLAFKGRLYIMTANGGSVDPQVAAQLPVRLIESGPAAGALAAAAIARKRGEDELLSFDMGGTTAKACLIENGSPLVRSEFETDRKGQIRKGSGLPIRGRVVDLVEIGAGGGSLAHWDSNLGRLRVGPQSAGADPGPVCYGRGGKQPTVTDADLLLGYLSPDYFLGGEMSLDIEAAQSSIAAMGEVIGRNLLDTAAGIYHVVNENMAAAARLHAVERGKDPRHLSIYAFGGAGPVHAYAVARLLGANRIVVPAGAGALSAFGLLSAPLAFDLYKSYYAPLDEINWSDVNDLIRAMEAEGRCHLVGAGLSEEISVQALCEMRYTGQAHEVQILGPTGLYGAPTADILQRRFEKAYKARYHRVVEGVPLEVLTWGVRVSGPLPEIPLPPAAEGGKLETAKKGERAVFWPELKETVQTGIYNRYKLGRASVINGPVIIEERESTTVVGPGAIATVDQWDNLVIHL